jgi:hypothetical protein
MALRWTQVLTEMSTRRISWCKCGRCVRLTILPPSCAVVMKSGNLNFLEPSGLLQACNGTAWTSNQVCSKRTYNYSRTSNCQCSLFSERFSIIRIFCISGWFAIKINPDKCSSTVLHFMVNVTTYTEFTSLEYGQVAGSFKYDRNPKLARYQVLRLQIQWRVFYEYGTMAD